MNEEVGQGDVGECLPASTDNKYRHFDLPRNFRANPVMWRSTVTKDNKHRQILNVDR